MPFKQMENLAKQLLPKSGAEALVLINKEGGVSAISKGKISAVKIAKEISEKMGGSAGGTDKVARGGGKTPENAEKTLKTLF